MLAGTAIAAEAVPRVSATAGCHALWQDCAIDLIALLLCRLELPTGNGECICGYTCLSIYLFVYLFFRH